MDKPATPVRIPNSQPPHIPTYVPPTGETHGEVLRQIHSTPTPPPSKK